MSRQIEIVKGARKESSPFAPVEDAVEAIRAGQMVIEWLPLEIPDSESTRRNLQTKKEKLGHKLASV